MTGDGATRARLHASTVAFPSGPDWSALVILGKSGVGKSELAVMLMAMGAQLVADDQTEFRRDGRIVRATVPDTLRGLLEVRGMGLLPALCVTARVRAFVDLDQVERERMPPVRSYSLLGQSFRLFHRVDSMAFAAGLRQYMLTQPQSEPAGQDD